MVLFFSAKNKVSISFHSLKMFIKLDDLGDSAKTLKGTGVEKLTSSFNLLKESFASGDIDKAKNCF